MRSALAALLLLASLLPALACRTAPAEGGGSATTHAAMSDVPAQVEALLRAQQAAWNRGDLEAFMVLGYARVEELTFFSGGDLSRGFDAMLERYRQRYQQEGAEMGRLAFSAIEVLPLEHDHALARGRWELEFTGALGAGGLFTLLLRRTPDGWRVVHDHTSSD